MRVHSQQPGAIRTLPPEKQRDFDSYIGCITSQVNEVYAGVPQKRRDKPGVGRHICHFYSAGKGNSVGAGNTALCDIGFAPNAAWCIGSVCRGFSCSAHAVYNMKKGRAWGASRREPMVQMIDLSMIKYIGPEDRKVPKQHERQEYAKKQKEEGEYKQWVI